MKKTTSKNNIINSNKNIANNKKNIINSNKNIINNKKNIVNNKKNELFKIELGKREKIIRLAELQLIIDQKAIQLVIKNHRLRVGKRELLVFIITVVILFIIIWAFSSLRTR